jgi:hypothetical protein
MNSLRNLITQKLFMRSNEIIMETSFSKLVPAYEFRIHLLNAE